MSVMRADTFLPMPRPMRTMASASAFESSNFFMKAPSPVFTSRTRASIPSAIFLLMIEEAMRGRLSTVAVTSRRAYSLRSAGAISGVCRMRPRPHLRNASRDSFSERLTRKPGIDSSLSSVPPVWPSPRPEIIGTQAPAAAASGARMRLVLSPTPPVECLSTRGPGRSERSSTSPVRIIDSVRATVSAAVIPLKKTAIARADAW